MKLHKVYNRGKELISCKGAVEVYLVKTSAKVGAEAAGGSGKEAKAAKCENCRITMDNNIISKIEDIFIRVKEMRDEVVTVADAVQEKMDKLTQKIETIAEVVENKQIRKTDAEAAQEGIVKIRQEFKKTTVEAVDKMRQEMISTVKNEMNSLGQALPTKETSTHKAEKKSYSEAVERKKESVIIVKPKEKSDACSSDQTKRDIKNSIDVAKVGVRITAMKKVKGAKGAVVIGCENRDQAEILRDKVANDMGEKYIIQAPKKKKLKIKIFDVTKRIANRIRNFGEELRSRMVLRGILCWDRTYINR